VKYRETLIYRTQIPHLIDTQPITGQAELEVVRFTKVFPITKPPLEQSSLNRFGMLLRASPEWERLCRYAHRLSFILSHKSAIFALLKQNFT